jgi:protein tyrosine phosphatase (PTP) superfamily phosphohydrolase (DUF442 family)
VGESGGIHIEVGMRPLSRLPGSLVALALSAVPAIGALDAQSIPPRPSATEGHAACTAARLRLAGLPNLGVVSDQLFRGAQPDAAGFGELKRLRIDIVVNLRHETDTIRRERPLVEAQGMRYVSIPWRGWDEPKVEQVAQFLSLLRDHPDRRVFVHCRRGSERTGVMVASYRMSRDHWTPEQALAEMEAFGFRSRFSHLTRFVHRFPALLLRDPVLRSVTAMQSCGDDVGAGDVSGPAQGRAGCAGPRTAAGGPRALDGGQVAGVAESGAFQPSEPTSNRRCLSEQR